MARRHLLSALIALGGVCVLACARADNNEFTLSDASATLGEAPRIVRLTPQPTLMVADEVDLRATTPQQQAVAAVQALNRARAIASKAELQVLGAPLLVNREISRERWRFEIHLLVAPSEVAPPLEEGARMSTTPSGLALGVDHHGSPSALHEAYAALEAGAPSGVRLGVLTWEQYLTDPTTTPDADNHIRVFRQVEAQAN